MQLLLGRELPQGDIRSRVLISRGHSESGRFHETLSRLEVWCYFWKSEMKTGMSLQDHLSHLLSTCFLFEPLRLMEFRSHLVRGVSIKITPTCRVPRFPMGQTGSQEREAGWDMSARGAQLFEETSQIPCGDSHQIPIWEARQPPYTYLYYWSGLLLIFIATEHKTRLKYQQCEITIDSSACCG